MQAEKAGISRIAGVRIKIFPLLSEEKPTPVRLYTLLENTILEHHLTRLSVRYHPTQAIQVIVAQAINVKRVQLLKKRLPTLDEARQLRDVHIDRGEQHVRQRVRQHVRQVRHGLVGLHCPQRDAQAQHGGATAHRRLDEQA